MQQADQVPVPATSPAPAPWRRPPTGGPPVPVANGQSNNRTHCDRPRPIGGDTSERLAQLSLQVAAWTISESDNRLDQHLEQVDVRRAAGVSPYWRAHRQIYPNDSSNSLNPQIPDEWFGDLWGGVNEAADVTARGIFAGLNQGLGIEAMTRASEPNASDPRDVYTRYALARGLCGVHGPHQMRTGHAVIGTSIAELVSADVYPGLPGVAPAPIAPAPAATFAYSFPINPYTGPDAEPYQGPVGLGTPLITSPPEQLPLTDASMVKAARVFHAPGRRVSDFVVIPGTTAQEWQSPNPLAPTVPVTDDAHVAVWLPTEPTPALPSVRNNAVTRAVSEAVVHEALIDHYARVANGTTDAPAATRVFALAARCAAKIRQLAPLARVATAVHNNSPDLPVSAVEEAPDGFIGSGDPVRRRFVPATRPCMRCPPEGNRPDGEVLYPFDAGIARFMADYEALTNLETGRFDRWSPSLDNVSQTKTIEADADEARGFHVRNYTTNRIEIIGRPTTTFGVRSALGAHIFPSTEPTPPEYVPLYAASPAEHTSVRTRDVSNAQPLMRQYYYEVHNDAVQLTPGTIRTNLLRGATLCERLEALKSDERFLRQQQAELRSKPYAGWEPEDLTRNRRGAIYNDALREAAISGDRLWTFVQQLSGTIAEPVDEICVLDETELMKQNRDRSDRSQRAAVKASDAHLQIVRSVFAAAMRDSGLKFGISSNGDDILVRNSTLQKQAAELTQRPPADAGFFTNAVNLEKLLTDGGKDMTLADLFAKLRGVAVELQRTAEDFIPNNGDGGQTSLEFLRAPRNSLFIQWKDQIKAGIRRAYDYFTNDMRQHGHMTRAISAYELIEGADPELCNSFAEFTAQYIAMTRMHNPSSAMYVSQNAAAVGSHKTRIALQRLVATACRYLGRYQSPSSAGSREAYFGGGGGAGVAMVMQQRFVNRGGFQMLVPRFGT